jgi:hypothetical protein
MPNDAKLGLMAGVMVVVIVAVFFYPRAGLGPAAIPGAGQAPSGQPAAQTPAPPAPAGDGLWKFSEPRQQKPVSKDPLMWPH